jgi:hypothetical protein
VDAALAALRGAMVGNDYKNIRERIEELNQATLPLAERLMNRAVSSALAGKRLSDV